MRTSYVTMDPFRSCAWLHSLQQRVLRVRKQGGAGSLQQQLAPLQKQLGDLVRVSALPDHFSSPDRGLTGVWRKDKERSDSLDEACDAIQLPWIYRKALVLLNTMEVEDSQEALTTKLKAGGIMDVVESYPWNGEPVRLKRRDKRKGHHIGSVCRTETGAAIDITWDDPLGGHSIDSFILSEDGHTLIQATDMTIRGSGRRCQYRLVYKRVH